MLDLFKALAPRASLRRESALPPPPLAGIARVTLSVRDRDVSAHFYRSVLGFRAERPDDRDGLRQTVFRHPSGLLIDLVQHRDNFKGRFDSRRCGLGRLTLAAPNLGVLEAWEDRFARMDVDHIPVVHTEEGSTLVFHDPDGTELALFVPADPDTGED
ncbi:VOC family protein [Nocardiopsis ganjiahuensis]|uniref:VOC family protein n=1 Tax=Nocardiopsis ganjiahuensis TaxID=239984 RepID=UPI000594249C|nr:VOC family protein [Nocardiopsis ganjiahuensis]